jgi:hypothetical protein
MGRDGRLLLTLGEAASRLGTGPLGIERLVREGLLSPADSDDLGRVWFDAADIDDVASGVAKRRRDSEAPPRAEPPDREDALTAHEATGTPSMGPVSSAAAGLRGANDEGEEAPRSAS